MSRRQQPKRPLPQRQPHHTACRAAPSIVQLWALRVLVHHAPKQRSRRMFGDEYPDALVEGLNLIPPDPDADADSPETVPSLRQQMVQNLRELEVRHAYVDYDHDYCQGLEPLTQALGLNYAETEVMQFAAAAQLEAVLNQALGTLNHLDRHQALHLISRVLDLNIEHVKQALSRQGVLARSGVLTLQDQSSIGADSMFDMLNDDLPSLLVEPFTELDDVLKSVVQSSPPATLELADYPHLQPDLGHALDYLKESFRRQSKGVNILLYGPPGTGKTELARLMAQKMSVTAYEVTSCDREGEPANLNERIRALMLAQACLKHASTLLLFDEVEEVFQGGADGFFNGDRQAKRKAWINRQLETNTVPTVWITNTVDHLDPAYARRFDVVLEVPVPPRAQREKVIRAHTGDLLDARMLQSLGEHEHLAPAVLARAARVAQASAKTRRAKAQVPQNLLNLVNQTLKVQGLAPVKPPAAHDLSAHYSLAHLNPDVPLDDLVASLLRHPHGRFCLYGPPGTGKSAFVHWLAGQINRPVLMRRASDLLSMWVGGNEKNIAQAFAHANRDGAVLLIDEVDTFLQPRQNAQRGWEASMVNEMLTQLERFDGLLFATTNLMQVMDPAAMRRFDAKVNFRAPTAEQLLALLTTVCKDMKLPAPSLGDCRELAKKGITPGDVAAVVRRKALVPVSDTADLLEAIAAEGNFKPGSNRQAVGFV